MGPVPEVMWQWPHGGHTCVGDEGKSLFGNDDAMWAPHGFHVVTQY